ncbi:MAG: aminotransferase class III-fold pyridoxal phosphate-dependent enzyme [candidate division KSB1 bacterium]|nr:aminotransferase class III-fold pyridoxal phosphate-dependent enzyme [candidate division KSB1 bacterium]MDZ7411965.1 aminotransferase class III-fold pyridoxal phosphate-dependent enzyme [candidate division KSB1 bacterium]
MTPAHREHLEKTLRLIPWATQTNAKRFKPETPHMPPFIRRASGCRIWDLDDRCYIDYRCALGPIILGYGHPKVEEAIRQQLSQGVLFSMASPLELEAAEAVLSNVPWLEQIRFMKTGADACSACVRLARALTGRDHIVSCGYHGYHDWSVVDWPESGVPAVLRQFTHPLAYGDIRSAERLFDELGSQIAAAVVEPYDWQHPDGAAFLHRLRELCDHHGALLVYDEVLTGFRLARGGAQEYFGITPDLAAYAKAIANGLPLSAFGGKRVFMQQLEKTVITITHGGEALSLAAGKATMEVMRAEPVHEHIFAVGQRLLDGFSEIIAELRAPARAGGLPPAPYIAFDTGDAQLDTQLKNALFDRLYAAGIFANDRWFVSYAHQPKDIDETLEKVREAFKAIL